MKQSTYNRVPKFDVMQSHTYDTPHRKAQIIRHHERDYICMAGACCSVVWNDYRFCLSHLKGLGILPESIK